MRPPVASGSRQNRGLLVDVEAVEGPAISRTLYVSGCDTPVTGEEVDRGTVEGLEFFGRNAEEKLVKSCQKRLKLVTGMRYK